MEIQLIIPNRKLVQIAQIAQIAQIENGLMLGLFLIINS